MADAPAGPGPLAVRSALKTPRAAALAGSRIRGEELVEETFRGRRNLIEARNESRAVVIYRHDKSRWLRFWLAAIVQQANNAIFGPAGRYIA